MVEVRPRACSTDCVFPPTYLVWAPLEAGHPLIRVG